MFVIVGSKTLEVSSDVNDITIQSTCHITESAHEHSSSSLVQLEASDCVSCDQSVVTGVLPMHLTDIDNAQNISHSLHSLQEDMADFPSDKGINYLVNEEMSSNLPQLCNEKQGSAPDCVREECIEADLSYCDDAQTVSTSFPSAIVYYVDANQHGQLKASDMGHMLVNHPESSLEPELDHIHSCNDSRISAQCVSEKLVLVRMSECGNSVAVQPTDVHMSATEDSGTDLTRYISSDEAVQLPADDCLSAQVVNEYNNIGDMKCIVPSTCVSDLSDLPDAASLQHYSLSLVGHDHVHPCLNSYNEIQEIEVADSSMVNQGFSDNVQKSMQRFSNLPQYGAAVEIVQSQLQDSVLSSHFDQYRILESGHPTVTVLSIPANLAPYGQLKIETVSMPSMNISTDIADYSMSDSPSVSLSIVDNPSDISYSRVKVEPNCAVECEALDNASLSHSLDLTPFPEGRQNIVPISLSMRTLTDEISHYGTLKSEPDALPMGTTLSDVLIQYTKIDGAHVSLVSLPSGIHEFSQSINATDPLSVSSTPPDMYAKSESLDECLSHDSHSGSMGILKYAVADCLHSDRHDSIESAQYIAAPNMVVSTVNSDQHYQSGCSIPMTVSHGNSICHQGQIISLVRNQLGKGDNVLAVLPGTDLTLPGSFSFSDSTIDGRHVLASVNLGSPVVLDNPIPQQNSIFLPSLSTVLERSNTASDYTRSILIKPSLDSSGMSGDNIASGSSINSEPIEDLSGLAIQFLAQRAAQQALNIPTHIHQVEQQAVFQSGLCKKRRRLSILVDKDGNNALHCKKKQRLNVSLQAEISTTAQSDLTASLTITSSSRKQRSVTQTTSRTCVCEICNAILSAPASLKTHMLIHSGVKPYSCVMCDASFRHQSTLKRHICIHTGEKKFVCNVCQSPFARKTELTQHQRSHSTARPFVCKLCGSSYKHPKDLSQHLRAHARTTSMVCKECNSSFYDAFVLKEHMQLHEKVDDLSCDVCKQSCSCLFQLTEHMIKEHAQDVVQSLPDEDTTQLEDFGDDNESVCRVCKIKFDDSELMMLHMQEKHRDDQRVYEVDEQRTGTFTEHPCKMCGFRFLSGSALSQHVKKKHWFALGELGDCEEDLMGSFTCTICGMDYPQQKSLAQHLKKSHSVNLLPCTKCGMTFIQIQEWVDHISCCS